MSQRYLLSVRYVFWYSCHFSSHGKDKLWKRSNLKYHNQYYFGEKVNTAATWIALLDLVLICDFYALGAFSIIIFFYIIDRTDSPLSSLSLLLKPERPPLTFCHTNTQAATHARTQLASFVIYGTRVWKDLRMWTGRRRLPPPPSNPLFLSSGRCFWCRCRHDDRHVVVAVILGDQADGGPVFTVIVGVVGQELLGAAHVEAVHLDGAAQGVAQQEHLHLQGDGEVLQSIHSSAGTPFLRGVPGSPNPCSVHFQSALHGVPKHCRRLPHPSDQ